MRGSLKLSSSRWPERLLWAGIFATGIAAAGAVVITARGFFAELGFRSRVLHDVLSPDGRFRAICQEVPALDGPEYQTRLHRADATFLVNAAYGGDAQPCREVVWSTDGSRLGVLDHLGQMTLVDAAGAMGGDSGRLPNRLVTLNWPRGTARGVRFVSPEVVEFDACDEKFVSLQQGCLGPYQKRRLDVSATPARGVSF